MNVLLAENIVGETGRESGPKNSRCCNKLYT